MKENFDFVQKGFRILLSSLSGFIGREMNRVYKNDWWDEVLSTLKYPKELPTRGDYGELLDSLDVANCIRLIDWKWSPVFSSVLSPSCRAWARELMAVRNSTAHIGTQDLDQPMAERALDTMALLCKEIDPDDEKEIRKLYKEVRSRANGAVQASRAVVTDLADSGEGTQGEDIAAGPLLKPGRKTVQKTNMTRKITYAGKTEVYPVYKVRLDALYYNDQNDRIATWITKYEAENGKDTLKDLNTDIYNRVIESFIVDSNSEAIQKTQKNIALVGQREPGVTLADGRIVDGNRRFTCLRRLQREKAESLFFETVILDMDIRDDKKQIKLLELAIQHGEEKKVDYDLIDYAVGTYRDVVQTGLLTVEEYAASTNESIADVKKRIEVAGIVTEFLDHIRLPEQYHIAREYQIYGLFQEMMTSLRQLDNKDRQKLKIIAFNNTMMHAITDQRKFIRDIKGLIRNNTYTAYFDEQEKWNLIIQEKFGAVEIRSKSDVDRFADDNSDITEELQLSMERALRRSRSQQLKARPAENVAKSISLMMDVDARLFGRMDIEEKESLKSELDELASIVENFRKLL